MEQVWHQAGMNGFALGWTDFKMWTIKLQYLFAFIHKADTYIQSDFQERALQKCIGQWS